MRNKLLCITTLFTSILFATPALAVMDQASTPVVGAYDGVLVKFKSGVSQTRMNRAFSATGSDQYRAFSSQLVRGLTHAQIGHGHTLSTTLSSLRNNHDVEFAEPNYILHTYAIPNDSRFDSLWALHNTGQAGGVTDADIDAPEAWDLQTGDNVIIAVVDTGVDYNHSDLSSNIWNNSAEIADNGRDDDGNGFVDDIRGWDFSNNDNSPMDDNNHGTHLAGTIAANGNNGSGVAGINWSARIMPLKFMNSAGAGSTANAIAAIDYAVANGARIINASWGGGPFSTAMFNAIRAANDAGVLFVAAAGNGSSNNDITPNYPADYDLSNVISVAATDDADTLAGFSNFGVNSVDLGAPGVRILSTIRNNSYASLNGTSMAAPHVSGVAALVVANNPGIGINALRAALLENTDAVADLTGRTVTGGRLNAFKALGGSGDSTPTPPTPIVSITPENTNVIVGSSVQFNASGGSAPYAWSVADTAIGSISASGNFTAAASGATRVTATDANGVRSNDATITVSDTTAVFRISPNTVNLSVGETVNFTTSGGNAPYAWSVEDTAIGRISASGNFTAAASGVTRVTATDASGVRSNDVTITVNDDTTAVFRITPNTVNLRVGETVTLTASGGNSSGPYFWFSNNSGVVNINFITGRIIARGTGVTSVIVMDGRGNFVSSGAITVTALASNNNGHQNPEWRWSQWSH